MLIPIQYSFINWEPPELTDKEELTLGRQIVVQGREHFLTGFRKSIGTRKDQAQRQPAPPLIIFIAVIFFVGGIWFLATEGLDPLIAVLLVIIVGAYLVSMHFALRKFERWIDPLLPSMRSLSQKEVS